MMLLKKIPFFLFLLPVFFCLHGGLENFGVIYLSEVLLIGLYISVALLLLFLLLFWITKDKKNAALTSFYAGWVYLFFGALQDWLKDIAPLSFLNRYSVLLPLLFVSILCLLYLLKRKKIFAQRLFLYMNILLIVYCTVDAVLLIRMSFSNNKDRISQVPFDHNKISSKPNVYYLLFDGYPGYASLRDSFGFRNDSLYNFLQGRGFTILPSFSNYNFTVQSMSSIFNMQFVSENYSHGKEPGNQEDIRKRFNEIKNAAVFSIYRNMGYELKNYSVFDIGKQGSINPDISFLPVHSKALTGKMLHKRIARHMGWRFQGTLLQNIFSFKEPLFQADATNREIMNRLKQGLETKTGKPLFCYAHFIMPHVPYFRDSTGVLINQPGQQAHDINDPRYFLPYLIYTNSVISSLVDNIAVKDPGAMVIVMSDHGFRKEYKTAFASAAFNNICAIRSLGNNLLPSQGPISGVNFFRYLFNKAYGQDIPYLKDSIVYVIEDQAVLR